MTTVPVSSRISGTRGRGRRCGRRARRATAVPTWADLDVQPVGAQQPGQHRREVGMRADHDDAPIAGEPFQVGAGIGDGEAA